MTAATRMAGTDPWQGLVAGADPADAVFASSDPRTDANEVTVVVGASGGAGATLVACGLALAVAEATRPVALMELDLAGGDIAGAWGVPPDRTLHDLSRVIDELAPHHVEMVCHPHPSRVSLLLAPPEHRAPEVWDRPATRLLLSCTRTLGEVVVDAGASRDPRVAEACAHADRIVVVAPPTVAGARRVNAVRDAIAGWSGPDTRIVVAANRGVGRNHLGARAFASAIGGPVVELDASAREADALGGGRWEMRRRGGLTRQLAAIMGVVT